MNASGEPSPDVLEYFRALRTEIVEAQKLRVQVGLAKTVFLGTLLGFFFKDDAKGDVTILVCPFVALMFDCMVYGLSFNIRDVGSYIGEHLEPQMALADSWQRHRAARVDGGFKDWGRIAFRVGSYGLSAAVSVVAFAQNMPPAGTPPSSAAWIWRIALIAILVLAWGALIYAEFSYMRRANAALEKPKADKGRAALEQEKPEHQRAFASDGEGNQLEGMEDHWQVFAGKLGSLFALMPGVDPERLGDDAQRFLASYKPPDGVWNDESEQLRRHFVDVMDSRTFQFVYYEYLAQRRKAQSAKSPG